MSHAAALARLVQFYETIGADDLPARLAGIYAPDARFKDPFNEVSGVAPIADSNDHMFGHVQPPRIEVTEALLQGEQAFLTWEFHFRMKRFSRAPRCIRGATHIRFGFDGAVTGHRDYWDAAEELYEKLPLLGALMRWLKRAARR